MELKLANKVAVVTGSSRGLGAAIAKALAAEGAKVVVNYVRNASAAEEVVADIRSKGGQAISVRADVSRPEDVEELFRTATDRLGPIDILVNNASIWLTAKVIDMTLEDWQRTIDTNLTSTFLCSQWVVRQLVSRGAEGVILNVTSQAAFHGSTTGHAHYAAAKAGVVAFTVSLAREVAKYGIRVNAIAPGIVSTDMTREALAQRGDYYLSRIPLGRFAEPEDVADAAVFMCSNAARYITGATLDVSGGMLMR